MKRKYSAIHHNVEVVQEMLAQLSKFSQLRQSSSTSAKGTRVLLTMHTLIHKVAAEDKPAQDQIQRAGEGWSF